MGFIIEAGIVDYTHKAICYTAFNLDIFSQVMNTACMHQMPIGVIHSSFPVMNKIDNVDIFVLLQIEINW